MALCLALKEGGVPFTALHFNHGLRPEADQEEQWLRSLCFEWGVPFYSRKWQQSHKKGSLQQNARQARYDFFQHAADEKGLRHILLAHTADDVAETTLMRLFYGSGTQGLARMARRVKKKGYTLHRPLLDIPRARLRAFLLAHKQPWLEDPSNYNPDHVRVRTRYWLDKFPPALNRALTELAHNCAGLEKSLKVHLSPYQDYIIQNQEHWAVINAQLLSLPNYARQRLFKEVFNNLTPGRHAPRPHKQQRLFQALQQPEAKHRLGQIQFQRKGPNIIARPEPN